MTLALGQILDGKYRVKRLVGEGGMGKVYEGEHIRIERRVAIKVLRPDAAARPELIRRFQQEAKVAAKIASRHVCDVLDLGDLPSGEAYLVMEFLDGEGLDTRLKAAGTLDQTETAVLAFQMLEGLATMHDAGIIHRDLKPANVFFAKAARSEVVKLLDFGVSKIKNDGKPDQEATAVGSILGTPLYMSPEQARGSRDIDGRSDLYAVGVILYRVLTRELPHRGTNFQETLYKISVEAPRRLEDIDPNIDADLADIIHTALAKDVTSRYQSAREFQDAIRMWGAARGIAFEANVSAPPPAVRGSQPSYPGATRGSAPPPRPRTPLPFPAPPPVPRTVMIEQPTAQPAPLLPSLIDDKDQSEPEMPDENPITRTAWAGQQTRVLDATPMSGQISMLRSSSHPPPRLSADLESANRAAAMRTRVISALLVAAAVAMMVGGFVYSRRGSNATTTASPAAPSGSIAIAQPAPSAIASNAAPTDPPTADPIDRGVSPDSLPASPAFNATPGRPRPPRTGSEPAPSASASSKPSWGKIEPTVPTIERRETPAPAPENP